MGGDHHKKKSKKRRRDRDDGDDDKVVRGSGVDYSKVADRHVDDARFEKHRQAASSTNQSTSTAAATSTTSPAATATQPAGKLSSQMTAVMRVMAGMEERTIKEKLADSNRPTWEQYKKDNEDKLNIEGLDQKKMDAYRKELDEQREKLLTRGTNHRDGKDDNKKSSKKSKKKKKSRKSSRYSSGSSEDSYSSDEYSSDDDRKSRKRKKHKRRSRKSSRYLDSSSDEDRKKKHKKKKSKKRQGKDDDSGDSYRLSSFFTKDDSDGDSR